VIALQATVALLAAPRPGFKAPGIDDFEWPCIWRVFGTSACINKVALLYILAAVVVFVLFFLAFRQSQMVPRGLQNFMEVGVDFVRDQIIMEVIGPAGLRFLPYLTTLFMFVFISNVLGIIPFIQFPATGRMAIPAILAVLTWLLFVAVGIRSQGLGHYFKNSLFPPGVPWPIYFLITPIEFVSVFLVRPVTLSVRLLANMIAGHLLLAIFFAGTAYLLVQAQTAAFGLAAFALGLALTGFELFVALLQAYIFTILTAVYLAGSLEPAH
jgi:F-type H+-transporting ATPase subunit a